MIDFTKIQMVGGRALARSLTDEEENKLASGIILPAKKVREFKSLAVILTVGGKYLHSSGLEIPFPADTGDIVILRDGFGIEPLTLNGEEFKVLEPSAVVGKLYSEKPHKVVATDTSITVSDADGNVITTIGKE